MSSARVAEARRRAAQERDALLRGLLDCGTPLKLFADAPKVLGAVFEAGWPGLQALREEWRSGYVGWVREDRAGQVASAFVRRDWLLAELRPYPNTVAALQHPPVPGIDIVVSCPTCIAHAVITLVGPPASEVAHA